MSLSSLARKCTSTLQLGVLILFLRAPGLINAVSCLCQLVLQVAEEEKNSEATEKVCPLLPQRRLRDQTRGRIV